MTVLRRFVPLWKHLALVVLLVIPECVGNEEKVRIECLPQFFISGRLGCRNLKFTTSTGERREGQRVWVERDTAGPGLRKTDRLTTLAR